MSIPCANSHILHPQGLVHARRALSVPSPGSCPSLCLVQSCHRNPSSSTTGPGQGCCAFVESPALSVTWSHLHPSYQVEISTWEYFSTLLNSTEQSGKPTHHRFSPDVGRESSREGGSKSTTMSPSQMLLTLPPHLGSGSSSPWKQ